jgi:hypothetical protein
MPDYSDQIFVSQERTNQERYPRPRDHPQEAQVAGEGARAARS